MHFLLSLQRCFQCSSFQIFRSAVTAINCNLIPNVHLLKSQLPVSTQVRTFWETFPHVRPLFYEKDGLSRDKYELVYHSKLFYYAFYGQLVSLVTLAIQIFAGSYHTYNLYMSEEIVSGVTQYGPFVVHYNLTALLIIGLFTVQNCGIYFAARKVVLRAYHCEKSDEFVFITLSKNPFKSLSSYCKPGELRPRKENFFNFLLGNHVLNGKRIFIRNDNFKSMYIYHRLIGDNYE